MHILYAPDANEGTASSPEPIKDATQTTTEGGGSVSSTDEGTPKGSEPSEVDQIIDRVLADSQPAKAEPAESAVPNRNQTPPEEGKTGDQGKEVSPVTPEGKQSEPEQPPFHEHPRWKEMVAERNELKEWKQQYEPALAGLQQLNQFRQQHQITDEQFSAAVEVAGLLNSDPVRALQVLKPIVEQLSQFDSGALPQDLAAEVEEGLISEERAKEIAELRAKSRLGETKQKASAIQQQQAWVASMQQGLVSWEENLKKSDPDFRPKVGEAEPDGKYEFVEAKLRSMWQQQPPRTAQEAVAQAQRAYEMVQKALGRLAPPKPVVKNLGVKTTSTGTRKDPETPEEAMEAVMARHGIS